MKRNVLSGLMGGCAALSLLISGAFAVAYDSSTVSYTVGDMTYSGWSTLYVDGGSTYRAGAWVRTAGNTIVPAGCLGTNAVLCNEDGDVIKSTGTVYNTVADYFTYSVTGTASSGVEVYSQGQATVVNGADRLTFDLPKTRTYSRSALVNSLADTLEADHSYPTTASGETYGSVLLADVVGAWPDLLSAVGDGGVQGYLRTDDLNPELLTREETLAYMQTRADAATIPLYDLNGLVIGSFTLEAAETEDLEEVQETVEALRRSQQETGIVISVEQSEIERQARLSSTLVDGRYPTNENGETYGSDALASLVGEHPDLMSAIGTNGVKGYIRRTDLNPEFSSAEEKAEYMAHQSEPRTIPLYDKDGNVIGTFLLESSSLTSSQVDAALNR